VLELQAEVFKTHDHVQLRQAGLVDPSEKHVRRRGPLDRFRGSNAGVEARAAQDKLALKGTAGEVLPWQVNRVWTGLISLG